MQKKYMIDPYICENIT